jgi:hypothetical protein
MREEHQDIIAALRRRPGSTVEDLAAILLAPIGRDLAAELAALEVAGRVSSVRVGSECEWFALGADVT